MYAVRGEGKEAMQFKICSSAFPDGGYLPRGIHQGLSYLLATGWTAPTEKLPDLSLKFSLYALDTLLDIPEKDVTSPMLESAMADHILDETSVSCVYT